MSIFFAVPGVLAGRAGLAGLQACYRNIKTFGHPELQLVDGHPCSGSIVSCLGLAPDVGQLTRFPELPPGVSFSADQPALKNSGTL